MRTPSPLGLALCLLTAFGCEKERQGFLPEDSGTTAPVDTGAELDVGFAVDAGFARDNGAPLTDRGGTDVGFAIDAGPFTRDTGGSAGGGIGSCNAVDLGSRTGASVATGNTIGGTATLEGSCGGDEAEEAVFAWTAPSAGRYTFDLAGSGYDTVLYLRDGLCATRELECNDDSDESVQSSVTVTLRAGQQVTIVIDGYGGDTGTFELAIRPGT